MRLQDLSSHIKKLDQFTIAVVGDFCLDQYWTLDAIFDQSLDYNSQVTFGLSGISYRPGGAGNVANNFIQLGFSVKCIGVIGDDGIGFQLKKNLTDIGACTNGIVTVKGRGTHTCIRPVRIADDCQVDLNEMITVNHLNTPERSQKQLIDQIEAVCNVADAIVFVEQFDNCNQGVFTNAVRNFINSLAKSYAEKIFLVDSRKYVNKYENMYLKCNQHEFKDIFSCNLLKSGAEVWHNGNEHAKGFLVTRGEKGMIIFGCDEAGRRLDKYVPTIANEASNVNTCGAGDSATAGIVLGLLLGYDLADAAMIGNMVASVSIQDIESTGFARPTDLVHMLDNFKTLL